jgi:hypothetical protein
MDGRLTVATGKVNFGFYFSFTYYFGGKAFSGFTVSQKRFL